MGDFEIVGFLSAGAGWQRQLGGVSTEFAEDGSFAGVLGSVLPNSITGDPPQKNEDTLESFVEIMELDFIKEIGERAKMRADLVFGRVLSGSAISPPVSPLNRHTRRSLSRNLTGDARRDNGFGGPNTNYAMGLLDLRFDLKENLYTVIRYSYAWQSEDSNGVLNLTGAKQQIHEISLGGGYMLADFMKLKLEGRFDIVDPAVGAAQYVPGVAGGFVCAF